MTRSEISALILSNILSGGKRTTAAKERELFDGMNSSYLTIDDDLNTPGGFAGVEAELTQKYLPYQNATGLVDSILRQEAEGIRLSDGKFISGDDEMSQLDFGSAGANYVWLSVDGQTGAKNFMYMLPDFYTDIGYGSSTLHRLDSLTQTFTATDYHQFDTPTSRAQMHTTGLRIKIGGFYVETQTANRVPYFDASNKLVSSSVTDTELGYLSGVTSSLQTQINLLQSGLTWKIAARVGVATNVTIASPGANLDGIAMAANDRVLLYGQSAGTENGLYVWNGAAVPMTRTIDTDTGAKILGMVVSVEEGTIADKAYILNTDGPITIGVTSLAYGLFSGTIYVGTSNRISVSGNVIDISATYVGQASITTLGTITTGTWNTTTTVTANSLTAAGTAGAGFMQLNSQGANVAAGATNSVRVWSRAGFFAYTQENDGFYRMFSSTATSNRVYTLQDADGTFAFLTDIDNSTLIVTNRRAVDYTLEATDKDKLVEMNNALDNNLTVPANATVAFEIGTRIKIAQYGAGQTLVVPAGGVTVNSLGGAMFLTGQFAHAELIKIGTNEWYLYGDITV